MEGRRKIHKISDNKKSGPFLKFNFGILILIFVLSFIGCFVFYMVSANMDDDYFNTKNNNNYEFTDNFTSDSDTEVPTDTQPPSVAADDSSNSVTEASQSWLNNVNRNYIEISKVYLYL